MQFCIYKIALRLHCIQNWYKMRLMYPKYVRNSAILYLQNVYLFCILILYSSSFRTYVWFCVTILYTKMYVNFVCTFCTLILYTHFCIIMYTKSVQNKYLVYSFDFVYTFFQVVQNRYRNFKNMQNWIPKFIHSCKFCSHINDKVCRVYPVPSCRPSGASTRHELYRHPSLSSME